MCFEGKPFLYVIIPVYKAERYIAKTLESVLAQPYPNICIVCVDDGSPDSSISIIREFAEKYGNIQIIQQKNAGVSAARNAGIEFAVRANEENSYLTFLDSDDCWAKNTITENSVQAFYGMDCVCYGSVRCSNDLSMTVNEKPLPSDVLHGGAANVHCHNGLPMGSIFMLYQ